MESIIIAVCVVLLMVFFTLTSKLGKYKPQVISRHETHQTLAKKLKWHSVKYRVRFGDTHALPDDNEFVLINKPEAIMVSSNKLLMKQAFQKGLVITANWWVYKDELFCNGFDQRKMKKLPFPIVAKHIHGSRGTGNYLIKSAWDLEHWVRGREMPNYIFEKFLDYNKEYRLHVSHNGCFYSCRKLLKNGTPEDQRWKRNNANSVWVRQTNKLFDKPKNWDDIVSECVRAIKACGLDFGGCDVKVNDNGNFFVIEINSAPSLGKITERKYLKELPKIARRKSK